METTTRIFTAGAVALAMIVGSLVAVSFAFADINSSTITIDVDNSGSLDNTTTSNANTGDNTADGSTGGDGGTGGDVEATGAGDNNNGGATTGNGGNGGTSGLGGTVFTGDADSLAGTVNLLNTMFIRVRN